MENDEILEAEVELQEEIDTDNYDEGVPQDEAIEAPELEKSKPNARLDYTQWLRRGQSMFIPTDNATTVERVDAGVYNLKSSEAIPFYLYKKTLHLDELMLIPSKESDDVMDTIHKFWDREKKFKEYGFVFKRGILLYGPPGTGKTSIINLISDELINKKDGVILILQNNNDLHLYRNNISEIFRVIEPNRPIITVIEDIDGLCRNSDTETTLINILDGIEQLENVIYIATTNFLEKLSTRLTNRPNRFDRRIKIGYPTPKARLFYIQNKLKSHDLEALGDDIKIWVEKTEGMTISHIGELIKSVIIMGNNFEETIKLLKELKKTPNSYDYNRDEYDEGNSIGFGKSQSKALSTGN